MHRGRERVEYGDNGDKRVRRRLDDERKSADEVEKNTEIQTPRRLYPFSPEARDLHVTLNLSVHIYISTPSSSLLNYDSTGQGRHAVFAF